MKSKQKIMIYGLMTIAIIAVGTAIGYGTAQLKNNEKNNAPIKYEVIFGTGEVSYNQLEGGFWVIGSDDGKWYDPYDTLPEEYREDGLRVRFKARIRPDLGGIHMFGIIIDILEIEKIV